jgi:deoxycytidylate deaminase
MLVASPSFSSTTLQWLKVAARQAELSDCDNRHGSALVIGGRLISTGRNKMRHDFRFCDGPCSVHAEIDCLRGVERPARGTIYIVRLGDDDTWRISKPCVRCYAYLCAAGIRRAVWSDEDSIGAMNLG